MNQKEMNHLCDIVRETSFAIQKYHRHGHLEKIYGNALAHRLRNLGLRIEQQYPLNVYDEDGFLLGEYFADLMVEQKLIVELKAVREMADEHVAQLPGYLRSARVETGLLINFGAPKLYIKKYLMTDQGQRRGFLAPLLTLF
jgi:GxxExxY protein